MAVIKGEMTSLPFLHTVEEPEDSRINFRDSLKFFQEQLVINGANFPSPSSGFRSGSNTLRKNGQRSYKAQISDNNADIIKESNSFETDIQSIKSCKIAIPTVDTILESVRVLRAIQKSQQERGSNWNLDVTLKSDIEFNCVDDWIEATDIKCNDFSDKGFIREDAQTLPSNSTEKQAITDKNQSIYSDRDFNTEKNDEMHSYNFESKDTNIVINQSSCIYEISNTEICQEIQSYNFENKQRTNLDINQSSYKEANTERNEILSSNYDSNQTAIDTNKNNYASQEPSNEKNYEQPTNFYSNYIVGSENQSKSFATESNNEKDEIDFPNSEVTQTFTDENKNKYFDDDYNIEKEDETLSTTSEQKQLVTDLNENERYENFKKEFDYETLPPDSRYKQIITKIHENDHVDKQFIIGKDTDLFSNDSENKQAIDSTDEFQNDDTKQNLSQTPNTEFRWPISNPVYEICSFWPSNTLHNEKHLNEGTMNDITLTTAEDNKIAVSEIINELNANTNLFQRNHKNFESKSINNENSTEQNHQNDYYTRNILQSISTLEHTDAFPSNTKIKDSSDALRSVCTDFFNHLSEAPNITEISKDFFPKSPETTTKILKIETYEDTVHKYDHFLLSESLWKESCSPNDSTSTKIEQNDSDSGIGTQRSASSLSPNNPNQTRKDSWSDTCSSHYASAECSPSHSLISVFETSVGLNSAAGETKDAENSEILKRLSESKLEEYVEKTQNQQLLEGHTVEQENVNESANIPISVPQENISQCSEDISVPEKTNCNEEKCISDKFFEDIHLKDDEFESHSGNAELDTEISYCHFITNYTIEKPRESIEVTLNEDQTAFETCDNKKEPNVLNGQELAHPTPEICDSTKVPNSQETKELKVYPVSEISDSVNEPQILNGQQECIHEDITDSVTSASEPSFVLVNAESLISLDSLKEYIIEEDISELPRIQKFSAASCDLISIVESLYIIKENPAYQAFQSDEELEEKFEESLFVLSKGAFCKHPEGNYVVTIEDSILHIAKDSQILLSLNMKYGEVSAETNILKIDNKMGRCVYIKYEFPDVLSFQDRIKLHCLKHWQEDCLQLVHYPLKCHQNVVIIDIGSCSTRAGILMDQPTLPSLFFPTICATDKRTGTCVYGMEALQPEVRQHSNLSFPVRPTMKITKHTIDINLMEGLFKKIFHDLKIDPTQYTVQVCLPRNLSIHAQTALVKLLLENLKVKAVSLTNQALLTLYAHDVSTAVVVDIGDRTDVLPVVDGFIVENGVTKLPYGGQRLIHHMKHGLAEKRISLTTDIDSFIVQYIIENLAYIAEDYEKEMQISSHFPEIVTKTVILQSAPEKSVYCKSITLEDARFKVPEGLFNPELWGLDSPGIHHLVQKAIQATSVDERKRIAENIYVSGGVTMLPGFVERLQKEVTKLSKAKIVPKVRASNYRYHCTYIGACKFAKMEVFPQICITLKEYTGNSASALKKCALYY